MLATRLITRQLEHFGGVSRNLALEGKIMLAMVINNLLNEEIQMKDFVGNDTLSRRIGVEEKAEDLLSITNQEADPSLKGK